jgi:hypothetical protein
MKFKLILGILLLAGLAAKASAINDTIILKSEIYPEKITADLDSLVNSWYVKIAMRDFPGEFKNDSVGIEFSDSVYTQRIGRINSIIKLPYNSIMFTQ